ncbi:MAG: AAA family ATPase [Phycisphaerae bacterium]
MAVPGVAAPPTPRLVEVCLRFGLSLAEAGRVIVSDLALDLRRGSVTLIVGPSGAGKTLLIREIARRAPMSQVVGDMDMPADVPVLDAVAPTRPINEAIGLLTACGLGEPWLWMRPFDVLSDGERFRARLARAVSLGRRNGQRGVLLCDEFGSLLHERLAKAVAFNLRKLAARERLAVVVATSREDIEPDLHPDCVIRLSRQSGVVRACRGRGFDGAGARLSFADDLQVVQGTLRDYEAFASMHYRHRQQVGFVSAVFVMRDRRTSEALGVVVYGHPSLELALRNKVTGGRYVRQAKLLNQEMRVLKRLIIHPDVRGCGLGHELVRRTLPMAGAQFVECLAVMGAVNPVFEKAGMRPVGVCCSSAGSEAALAWLKAAGADPLEAAFTSHVRCRPAVRRVVAREVANWYRATTGGGKQRVRRQTPTVLAQTYRQIAGSQPVYFIWAADREGWEIIDANLGESAVQLAQVS